MKKNKAFYRFIRITLILLIAIILFTPFVVVNAGERGVLMKFGEVQNQVLGEGIHLIIPLVNTVKKLSVRIQKEAETKVNLARGEAAAQRLLRETLTQELLQRQAIEKWDGKLPKIMGNGGTKLLDLSKLLNAE